MGYGMMMSFVLFKYLLTLLLPTYRHIYYILDNNACQFLLCTAFHIQNMSRTQGFWSREGIYVIILKRKKRQQIGFIHHKLLTRNQQSLTDASLRTCEILLRIWRSQWLWDGIPTFRCKVSESCEIRLLLDMLFADAWNMCSWLDWWVDRSCRGGVGNGFSASA